MIPAVLSGGAGTRLWPLSRAAFPKQFCELLNESLLEKTLKRLQPFGSPWTLTVKSLNILTERLFRQLGIPFNQILFEPAGRNTAPAIALLCHVLKLKGLEHEIVGIFPADHLIEDEQAFRAAIELAQVCAAQGDVVTLGIQPSYPATGFGYIETSREVVQSAGSLAAFRVRGFREKPDQKTAEEFMHAGQFFWNAGIFIFKVQSMIENFARHLPEVWLPLQALKADLSNLTEIYGTLPSISIDYGIMEKLSTQVCIPCDVGWSDLGSWDDVAKFGQDADELGNFAHVVNSGSQNCFAFSSQKKLIGLVGVNDLIVVDTPDALLVAQKGQTQNVRAIVDQLASEKHMAATEHPFDLRPWGRYTVLRDEPHFKSKVIIVYPRSQLSYQSHLKRAEQWVIVKGRGEVVLNDVVYPVKAGDSIYIPVGAKHRMRNTGSENLEFVEVQTGSYFGEDDIVRYQDDYNRS